MVSEVTSIEVVSDDVQLLVVLEGVEHVDYEGVVEAGEDEAFVHDRLDTLFLNEFYLGHFFQGVDLAVVSGDDFVDFTESASSDQILGPKQRINEV